MSLIFASVDTLESRQEQLTEPFSRRDTFCLYMYTIPAPG